MGAHLLIFDYGSSGHDGTILGGHSDLKVQLGHNLPGGMTFQYPRSLEGADQLLDPTDRVLRVFDHAGRALEQFFLLADDGDDETDAGGDARMVTCAALELPWAVLNEARVYPEEHTPSATPAQLAEMTQSHAFKDATPGKIMRVLIQRAQARGALEGLTWTFTDTVDSSGQAWPSGTNDLYDPEYTVGMAYDDVLSAMVANGWCEVRTAGYELKMFRRDSAQVKVDRPGVVLRIGQNITEAPRKRTRRNIVNTMLGVGAPGNMIELKDGAAITTSRRKEGYLGDGRMTTGKSLTKTTQAELESLSRSKEGITLTYKVIDSPTGEPAPQPSVDFKVGDTIRWDRYRTVSGESLEPLRVMAMTWQLSPTSGDPSCSIELNDLFMSATERLQRIVRGINNGSSGSGSPPPPPPPPPPVIDPGDVEDKTIPKPVTGVTVSTDVSLRPSTDPFKQTYIGDATVEWTNPTQNTDDTPIADPGSVEVRIRVDRFTEDAWRFRARGDGDFTEHTQERLSPGEQVQFGVRYLDKSGNTSGWVNSAIITIARDETPPPKPAAPLLTTEKGVVWIRSNLLDASGATLPPDLNYLEVWREVTNGPLTRLTNLHSLYDSVTLVGSHNEEVKVYFVAVDTSGNKSVQSNVATILVQGVVDADLIATTLEQQFDAANAAAQGALEEAQRAKADAATAHGLASDATQAAQDANNAAVAAYDKALAAALSGTNFFSNGDFEAGNEGWEVGNDQYATVVDVPDAHGGSKVMRFTNVTPQANKYPRDERWFPTDGGRKFLLQAWVRKRGAGGGNIGFVVQATTTAGGVSSPGRTVMNSADLPENVWTKITWKETLHPDAVKARFSPWVTTQDGAGTVIDFDDMLAVDITEAEAALERAEAVLTEAVEAAQGLAESAEDAAKVYADVQINSKINLIDNPSRTGQLGRWAGPHNPDMSLATRPLEGVPTQVIQNRNTGQQQVFSSGIGDGLTFDVHPSKAYQVSMWVEDELDTGDASAQLYFGCYVYRGSGSTADLTSVYASTGDVGGSTNNYYWLSQKGTEAPVGGFRRYVFYLMPVGTLPADMQDLGVGPTTNAILPSDGKTARLRVLNYRNTPQRPRSIWIAHPTVVEVDPQAVVAAHKAIRQAAAAKQSADAAIIDSVIEYAVGVSATEAPTSGWTTNTPTRTPGSYIWMRTRITYGSGSTNVSSPTLVTGNDGAPGAPASTVTLTATTQALALPAGGGATSPATAVVTGSAVNTTIASWEYSVNGAAFSGTVPTGVSRSGNTVTVTGGTMTARTIAVRAVAASGVTDTLTVAKISDGATGGSGADAYTVLLTNESHTFPGSTTAATAGTATTSPVAYKGTTQQPVAVGTITGQVTGLTTGVTGSGTNAPTITVTVTTALTAKSGMLTIPLTVDGKSFTKTFSWALSLTGTGGSPGAPGVSITSVTPYFRRQPTADPAPAKPTTMTPTGWVTTEPDYLANNTLYRTERVVYSDNSFAYTDVTKVSSWAIAAQALTSANGRNSRTTSTAAATGTTNPATGLPNVLADTWWQWDTTAARNVIGQWAWDGGAWVREMIGHQTIASMDVNKLVVTGSARMEQAVVGKIIGDAGHFGLLTAEQLTIGRLGNLIPNGQLEKGTLENWGTYLTLSTDVPPGTALTHSVMCNAGQGASAASLNAKWDIDPDQKYRFEVWLKADFAGSRIYIEMRDTDSVHAFSSAAVAGENHAGNSAYPVSNQEVPTTWTKYVGVLTPTAGKKVRVASIYWNHPNGIIQSARQQIAGLRLTPLNGAIHLEDGAVTTPKLFAGAVTTAKLDALAVTADKIAANAITAAKIDAGAIQAWHLALGSVNPDALSFGTDELVPNQLWMDANMRALYPATGRWAYQAVWLMESQPFTLIADGRISGGSNFTYVSPKYPVGPKEKLYLELTAVKRFADTDFDIGIRALWRDAAGALLTSSTVTIARAGVGTGVRESVGGVVTAPAGAASFQIQAVMVNGSATLGSWAINSMSARRAMAAHGPTGSGMEITPLGIEAWNVVGDPWLKLKQGEPALVVADQIRTGARNLPHIRLQNTVSDTGYPGIDFIKGNEASPGGTARILLRPLGTGGAELSLQSSDNPTTPGNFHNVRVERGLEIWSNSDQSYAFRIGDLGQGLPRWNFYVDNRGQFNWSGGVGGIIAHTVPNGGGVDFITTGGGQIFGCEYLSSEDRYYFNSGSIYYRTTTSSANVNVNGTGRVMRSTSLREYKVDINYGRDAELLAAVRQLQPVTFRDRGEIERGDLAQPILGFIAEDVEATGGPGFATYDPDGRLNGVAYDRIPAALVVWLKDLDRRLALAGL